MMENEKVYIPVETRQMNRKVEIFIYIVAILVYICVVNMLDVKYYQEYLHIIYQIHLKQLLIHIK